MQLEIVKGYAALSRVAAYFVAGFVRAKPEAVVVLPTGNTPVGMYSTLVELKARGEFDASRLRVCQLDDYFGLAPDDPRSLYRWMHEAFMTPQGIKDENIIRFRTDKFDAETACEVYDASVTACGGFDLSVLGIGVNGHIGFNEPPTPADAPTRVLTLSKESLTSNAAYWGSRDLVPLQAITCGTRRLLTAGTTLLLVSGESKREVLKKVLSGVVSDDLPASHLRNAEQVLVLADEAAASF